MTGNSKMDNDQSEIEKLASLSPRIMSPAGSIYRLSSKTVSEMADQELLEHIQRLKAEMKLPEQTDVKK